MATTYPLATLGPTISSTGISIPTYADVLASLTASFQSIYGSDIYVEPDSKDGQMLAIYAQAVNDANNACVSVYNAYSPATAQGANLSSVVKINGISRNVSSASTVDVLIVGQAGTTITSGVVTDSAENPWSLPATVNIPPAGEVTVTATCQTQGAIVLTSGSALQITTPTRGWQSATAAADAAEGAPVEQDPTLRQRQTTSTAIPSLTVMEGIVGAVANVTGVTRYAAYENDTKTTDSNGITANAIALVVEGGDATAIADAIAAKKTPGGPTFGTTSETVTNIYGMPIVINFSRPSYQAITVAISLKALSGYTTAIGVLVQTAVSDYINSVAIGGGAAQAVEWDSCITAAKSVAGGTTFKISALTLTGPSGAGSPDIAIAFNQAGSCTVDSVVLTVT
jgi:uncharacterized phage protein gp47/JayE